MASSVRIDGSLPDLGDNSTKGLVLSGGWAVEYDWNIDRVTVSNQPRRLNTLGFPSPFDSNLEGALRGRAAFSSFIYLFKNGRYLRLHAATMLPDGPDAPTAPAWGLPASWISFDAVLPGRGIKINFCYFFRGSEYIRFDWTTDSISPGYPKLIGPEWHLTAPFNDNIDGVIVGQSSFTTKGYLFKSASQLVSNTGVNVPVGSPGAKVVVTPGYARYDFTAEAAEGTLTNPADVVSQWNGLLPLLDAGPAIDTALHWCDAALAALATPSLLLTNALTHHFMTGAPNVTQLAEITARMTAVRNRIALIPDRFQWTTGFTGVAQTAAGTLTEIGNEFSSIHGPNGRAAVMIHEAVHFVFTGGLIVDVPEWSGETVNGIFFAIVDPITGVDVSNIAYHTMTVDQSIRNPSSYASFAQEIVFGADVRFGIARPHE